MTLKSIAAVSWLSIVLSGIVAAATAVAVTFGLQADKRAIDTEAGSPILASNPSNNAVGEQQALASLEAELRQEQSSRLELQRQVAALEEALVENISSSDERINSLEQQLAVFNEAGTESDSPDLGRQAAVTTGEAGPGNNRQRGRDGFRRMRDRSAAERVESLQEAGIDPLQAEELVQRVDQRQLAELELRDEAARGGWLDSERFGERLEELRASAPDLRTEIGDDAFDRYLYASGANNRVRISNVISGSAASSAGIQDSDVILTYAGKRVFNTRELQRATRDGLRGESVPVTVQRGDETLEISVTRGPLGVSLQRDTVRPGS